MGTTEVVLAVLVDGPRHGYDVKRIHDEWFPSGRPLAYGQVYAALSRLEKDGCVEVVETRVESGPERTVYALTRRGRERVESWLTDPVDDPSLAVGELVRKTVSAVRTAADPRPMLARQRTAYLKRMRELQGQGGGGDPLSGLARDHALEHLDADLRWLERAADQVAVAVSTNSVPGRRTAWPCRRTGGPDEPQTDEPGSDGPGSDKPRPGEPGPDAPGAVDA